MNVALVSIGDELLIGKTINTNAAWLGERLSEIGFDVRCVETISDNREQILSVLSRLTAENPLIIITGGLGPTNDDITKHVLCEFFQTSLEYNEQAYNGMAQYVTARGQEINDKNLSQAQFPKSAKLIHNPCGTASGMRFEKNNCVVISLPGVPHETKAMMTETIIPQLQQTFELPAIFHRHVLVSNITESKLAETIADWEMQLPSEVHLAYLPSPGFVKLRMSCVAQNQTLAHKIVEREEEKLSQIIGEFIWGYDDDTPHENVGKLLLQFGETVSTAESCTCGNISHQLTSISGSSAYYWGSIISYDNSVKINELQVLPSDIDNFGVVSQQVVETMAKSVRKKIGTTYGVATSGIAGPTGGTLQKPVGTVWIAVASAQNVVSQKFTFGNNRLLNIEKATVAALLMLQKLIQTEHNA